MDPLEAISPIDGRYRGAAAALAPIFSEAGLMRYRIVVETEYLIALSEHAAIDLREFSAEEKALLRSAATDFSLEEASTVQKMETTGYADIKATNHDVKAIEYFLKKKLADTSLKDCLEYFHFALTSEDVNNLAYALMLRDGVEQLLAPQLTEILNRLRRYAADYADLPMLARTHGQPATPTTFGKEMAVFAARLDRQLAALGNFKILAKLNGATGNYNAHLAAYPEVDWPAFSQLFINRWNESHSVQIEANLLTTQIEPHDSYAELFDVLRRINMILIDFSQDMWRYVSDGWLAQKAVEGEVGSSTMPHKINPIRFENAEGNFGMANALFTFFSAKLPVSRLQRDLSDSTVERNFGTAFAHCLIGYNALVKGLERVRVSEEAVVAALREHPEVLAEAIQTALRREGVPLPYEQLKALTRGTTLTLDDIQKFIASLSVNEKVKQKLSALTPETYTGLAATLARRERDGQK